MWASEHVSRGSKTTHWEPHTTEEKLSRFRMRGDALQEREGVAYTV